jgi:hypothetical protein
MAEARPHHETRRSVQRRRRRRRRALQGLVSVVVLTALAGLLTDSLRWRDDRPRLAEGAERDRPVPPASTGPSGPARRALSPEDPLRVWIGGDSIAGAVAPVLGQRLGATGVVQPRYLSRVSSGLASPDFWNWPRHAGEELRTHNPEVAVFVIGTNDAITFAGTDADRYRLAVTQMAQVLTDGDREVYWVGTPVLRDERARRGALAVNAITREVLADFPTATFIDAFSLLDDPPGEYTSTLADDDGRRVVVRAGDGVHLTTAGAALVAGTLFDVLDTRWRISAQARPDRPKPLLVSKGTTTGAGGSPPGRSTTGTARRSTGTPGGTGGTTRPAPTSPSTRAPATTVPPPPPPAAPPPSSAPPTSSPPTTTPPATAPSPPST